MGTENLKFIELLYGVTKQLTREKLCTVNFVYIIYIRSILSVTFPYLKVDVHGLFSSRQLRVISL